MLGMFFVFIFAFGMLFFAQPASALFQEVFNALIRWITWIMLTVAQLSIGFTIFCLRFFITLASYNNYIDVDVVMLGWVMVRDVANMFFVVALLVMAFATILGLEQYEWKKELVKLILAAIFINFSNLICQVIIDIAHVFTMTFLNAVSAAAGGNLINMFKQSEILEMARGKDNIDASPSGFDLELMAAGIVAMAFALVAAVAMGAYVIVMVIRVTLLWALIILSPLAYILNVLPKTQEYAKKWWSMFGKQVIVAPVMVFFLWLSFATLGMGDIAQKIQSEETIPLVNTTLGASVEFEEPRLSLSKVSSWENMASFIIALIFMILGIKVTQETGAVGAGIVGGALNFAKKVGTIASGYAAGRWLVGKGAGAAKKYGGAFLKEATGNLPVIGWKGMRRTARRLDEWRKQNKWVRHIPLIGGYRQEYQQKLDERVDKVIEMQKSTRMKDMSKTSDAGFSAIGVNLVNGILSKIPVLKKLGQVDYEYDEKTGKYKLDEKGNKIPAKAGLFGMKAWTARRNFAEYQELASVQMRSPENKKAREAANRARLLNEGRELILKVEDDQMGDWAQRNGLVGKDGEVLEGRLLEMLEQQGGLIEEGEMGDLRKQFEESMGGKKAVSALRKTPEGRAQLNSGWDEFKRNKLSERFENAFIESMGGQDAITALRATPDGEQKLEERRKQFRLQKLGEKYEKDFVTSLGGSKALEKLEARGDEGQAEISRLRAEFARKQSRSVFRADQTEADKLKGTIGQINNPTERGGKKWMWKRDEGVIPRAVRNAASYLVTNNRVETLEKEVEQAKSLGKEVVMGGVMGEEFISRRAQAEMGATIGENIVKRMKNAHWEDLFSKALEGLRTKPEAWLDSSDPGALFARAIKEEKVASNVEENMNIVKGEVESIASGKFIEEPGMGKSTYSQAFVAAAKRMGDGLNRVDEAGRAEYGSKAMMRLAYLIKQARESGKEGAGMTVEKEMYGVLFNLSENMNLDDAIANMGTTISRYERNEDGFRDDLTPEEVEEIEEARRFFGAEGEFALMERNLRRKTHFKGKDGKVITDAQGNEVKEISALTQEQLGVARIVKGAIIDASGNIVRDASSGQIATDMDRYVDQLHGGKVTALQAGAFVDKDGKVLRDAEGKLITQLTKDQKADGAKALKDGGFEVGGQVIKIDGKVVTDEVALQSGAIKAPEIFLGADGKAITVNVDGEDKIADSRAALSDHREELATKGIHVPQIVTEGFYKLDDDGNQVLITHADGSAKKEGELSEDELIAATSKYKKISGQATTNIVENYMGTGGNERLLRTHKAIEAYQAAHNGTRDKKDWISYAKAAKMMFDGARDESGNLRAFGALNTGLQGRIRAYMRANSITDTEQGVKKFFASIQSNYTDLVDQFDRYSSRLNDMGYAFKRHGLDKGHAQLGGHQVEDQEMGTVRMNTAIGARELMNSSIRKRAGFHRVANPHSLSDTDADGYRSQALYLTALRETLNKLTRTQDISGMFSRTIEALLGQKPSTEVIKGTKEGETSHAILGGDKDELLAEHGGDMRNFNNRFVMKWLLAAPDQLPMVMEKMFKNVNAYEAQEGMMKTLFWNRSGTDTIRADSLSQFIRKVKQEFLKSKEDYDMLIQELWDRDGVRMNQGDIDRMLASAESAAREKEQAYTAKGGRRGGGQQARDDDDVE